MTPLLCLTIQTESAVAQATRSGLEAYGFRHYGVHSIESAIRVMAQWRFDVVMLDADGFGDRVPEMLRVLRNGHVPVLVSSSEQGERAQIRQLEHGATAMVAKPASVRLTALQLRKLAEIRHEESRDVASELRLGPLLIDIRRVRASVNDTSLELSPRQFEILLLLARKAGAFVGRQEISTAIRWGGEDASRGIDMQMSRLRRRLREAGTSGLSIHTLYGRGYCLSYRGAETVPGEAVPKWCS